MQQVADWLEKLGLGQYVQRFAENDISCRIVSFTDRAYGKVCRWRLPAAVNRSAAGVMGGSPPQRAAGSGKKYLSKPPLKVLAAAHLGWRREAECSTRARGAWEEGRSASGWSATLLHCKRHC